jgi:hypothetical protein
MIGQKKFKRSTCKPLGELTFCVDHHTFFHRFRTGSDGFYPTLHLYKAQTAGGSSFLLFPDGTEVGNIDAVFESSEEDVLSLAGFYVFSVNG